MSANLFELFQNSYRTRAEQIFLQLDDGSEFSFAEVDRLSAQMAKLLNSRGVEPGDRVMAQVEKTPAMVALYLASLRTGAVFVPLNTAFTPSEVDYFMQDAAPRLFFCSMGDKGNLREIANRAGVAEVLELGITEAHGFWRMAAMVDPDDRVVPREEGDLAAFLYTSGTTGRSKGAMLSHGNLASNVQTLHKLWQLQPEDVLLHALPIFHIHGLFVALHCALLNASRVLFMQTFDPERVIEGLRGEATVMMGVPTFYTRLLANPDFGADDCSGVRLFISGSAPMTEQVHAEWTERTGQRILERYGMTEAGMITSNPCDGDRVPGTVGFPLPGISVRISDDSGAELPRGEIGSIEVKGPNIFQGYWKMPKKTAEEFRADGYFITGDLGRMDDEGRVSIVGREKDLIISGGYNVYPKEIELLIDEMAGVVESAVIGLPHPDFGEAVVAVVVPENADALTREQLIAQLKESVAGFKCPKICFFVDQLPRNTMGKVQKNLLREQFKTTFE